MISGQDISRSANQRGCEGIRRHEKTEEGKRRERSWKNGDLFTLSHISCLLKPSQPSSDMLRDPKTGGGEVKSSATKYIWYSDHQIFCLLTIWWSDLLRTWAESNMSSTSGDQRTGYRKIGRQKGNGLMWSCKQNTFPKNKLLSCT